MRSIIGAWNIDRQMAKLGACTSSMWTSWPASSRADVPVTVCWVDGRCFTIDEIVSSTGFGLTVHGVRTATYKVRFGGHATELYLEDQARERPDGSQAHVMRWWVWAFDRTLEGDRRR